MSLQSNVQQLLQTGSGLQTTAQSGVPSGVNNGNPNTPYNWASYIPSIINNSLGQPTGATFNPITATVPNMSPYGNQTPFTPDPFIAMLLSQLQAPRSPQASQLPGYGQGNSLIDRILANMLRGPTTPAPTTPGTTTPPGGGTTTPPGGGTPVIGTPPSGTGSNAPAIGYDTVGVAPISSGYGNTNGTGGSTSGGSGTPGSGSYFGPGGPLASTFGYDISPVATGTSPFSQNPVGSGFDFSTSPLTGYEAPQQGNFFTRLADSLGLVPADSSPGGFWSDVLASGAESLGINGTMDPNTPNTFNPAQALASVVGGPAGSALYNTIMGPGTVAPSNNLGGVVTSGPEAGFGMSGMEGANQGSWNIGDTYTPPNYDFSNLATSLPTGGDPNFDPSAYLDSMRAAEPPPGTATNNTAPAVGSVINTTTGQGGNGTYTDGPYAGMTEDQVRGQMATQGAFFNMQQSQQQARLAAELRAAMEGVRQ